MNPPTSQFLRFVAIVLSAVALAPSLFAQSNEVILQYFNTSWKEIEYRMPEVAEAGYTSLWLPPPFKGSSGTYSVGFDTFDRFDLGDKDQMGTVRTKYGTKRELLSMIEVAHRFGIRVYFDNVMAHNAGPLDPVAPGEFFPRIPGFVPEDFHFVWDNGNWRKASDSINYNDEWQVLNRNPFAWDIAQEDWNTSFNPTGTIENNDYPKFHGIRHPGQTHLYLDDDLPLEKNGENGDVYTFADKEPYEDTGYGAGIGAGNGRFDWDDTDANGQHDTGETSEPFTDTGIDPSNPARRNATWGFGDGIYNMGDPVIEDVNQMLYRQVRWFIDVANVDGFRLDAVKHVPSYFFGKQDGGDKDKVNWGYNGQIQEQFNITHGYSDWGNHRDSNFSNELPRGDALLFGEHLGSPPDTGGYLDAGMRIANDDFLNRIGGFAGIGNNLYGYDAPGFGTFGVNTAVMYCMSHDNTYIDGSVRPSAHQYMLTRAGIPIVYTDGYNQSGAPDYFPKPSGVPFLGQYGFNWVTGPLKVRQDFVRGSQIPKFQDENYVAYEMRDKRENGTMDDASGTVLMVMLARSFTAAQGRVITTTFPPGSYLKNYSEHGGGFFAKVWPDGQLRNTADDLLYVPSGGYFAFSWANPEEPAVWQGDAQHEAIEIYQNGVKAPTMSYQRKDGKDGDPAYAHLETIPRITDGGNLRFLARADGSAENILMKLDGGIDINSHLNLGPQTGDLRDNRPGSALEMFLGYEQMQYQKRIVEKFAARDVARNIIGSQGCETYQAVIGTAGFTVNDGNGENTSMNTAQWLFHDPAADNQLAPLVPQFSPVPAAAAGEAVTLWLKVGYANEIDSAHVYFTTDGTTYPEGIGGEGRGSTQAASFTLAQTNGGDQSQWWTATLPPLPSGTVLRYKIGAYKNAAASRFPSTARDVTLKNQMQTTFAIDDFNAGTVAYHPHNNHGIMKTGLSEGFHILRTRAFLDRTGFASIFKTNTLTFYYDAAAPGGDIVFPKENDTLGGSTYGIVGQGDATVSEVWYKIIDSDSANDDSSTNESNGNAVWKKAASVKSLLDSGFAREWRFDYRNIPASGVAQILVRFKEASSLADNELSDAAGNYTTITRTVNTGFAVNYRIDFPTNDGDTVGQGYTMKTLFDKSLGFGVSDAEFITEFDLYIDDIIQNTAGYSIIRNETPSDDAFAFTLPNLYDSDPNFLHELRVVHQRGGVILSATRLIKAEVAALPDFDGDSLPNFWELLYGLDSNNANGVHGPDGDFDGDGISNLAEYLAFTSPIGADIADFPIRAITANPDGTYSLEFPIHPNRVYTVEYSGNLVDWQNAGAPFTVTTNNPTFQWKDDGTTTTPEPWNTDRRYYRLRIALP